MKLSDCITKFNDTGECEIDVDKAAKCLGKTGWIHQWKETYRLVNSRAGVKITIKADAALKLIDKLGLVEVPHVLLANQTSWLRP